MLHINSVKFYLYSIVFILFHFRANTNQRTKLTLYNEWLQSFVQCYIFSRVEAGLAVIAIHCNSCIYGLLGFSYRYLKTFNNSNKTNNVISIYLVKKLLNLYLKK